MKPSTISEMKNSAIHNGVGITPAAPWIRSCRASWRVEVCSSHWS